MPADLAKQILHGRQFEAVRAGEGARELVLLASRAPGVEAWLAALEDADTRAIIGAISGLASHPSHENPLEIACREAARSMVDQKLTDRMVEKMDSLEKASNRLAIVGIVVAAVIAVVEVFFSG